MPRLCSSLLLSLLIGSSASAVTMDWTPIGNPGNACDPQSQGCFGAVGYDYFIGTYEVTNGQYAEFLNAVGATDTNGLYNPDMAIYGGITRSGNSGSFTYATVAGRVDQPVNFVSSYDAKRFANWLTNGQPTGVQGTSSTEDGSYTFGGAFEVGARNPNAVIVLPTENEWYKAAYYDPSATAYHVLPFPDGVLDIIVPGHCQPPPGTTSHSANCGGSASGGLSGVGAYVNSPSAYGTFDQAGNVNEWNEAMIRDSSGRVLSGMRGGGFADVGITSYDRLSGASQGEFSALGFRLAMVPEPGTGLLVIAGLLGLAGWRRTCH